MPILLTDTAGLRDTDEPVERIGVARSHALIERADILLWLGEPDDAPPHPRADPGARQDAICPSGRPRRKGRSPSRR